MLTYYVAIAPYTWGRGESEAAARKQCLKAGANWRDRMIVYRNERPDDKSADSDRPHVDDMGNVCYFGINAKVATYKNGKRTADEEATVKA